MLLSKRGGRLNKKEKWRSKKKLKKAGEGGTGEDRDKRRINEDKWKNNEVGGPAGEEDSEPELERMHLNRVLAEDLQQKWCKSMISKLIGQLCKWDSLI